MPSWPVPSTPIWSEASTSPSPPRSPSHEPSSTACSRGRRRSSPTRCPRPWPTAGVRAQSRSSSARTRRSWPRRQEMRRMSPHKIATRDEWLAARAELLEREKELTRASDELARQRRELPWLPVDKQYTLQTADGPKTLAELFDGRSQLLIYHFMFGPSFEEGCPTNSSIADAIDGLLPHLQARDTTLMLVSGAPIEKLLAYRERMDWDLNWASSYGSDFDLELGFSSTEEETRARGSSRRSRPACRRSHIATRALAAPT